MAKLICKSFLGALITLFCAAFWTTNASALNLSNTGDMWIDSIQYERGIYGTTSWSLNTVSPPVLTDQLQWTFSINNMSAGNEISRLFIKYKSEPSGPALISFDISYYIESPNSAFVPIYNGLKFKNRYVLLNDSCVNSVGVPMTYTTKNTYTFECSYLIYASTTTSKSIDTEAGSPIFSAPGTNNNLTIRIGPANYVEVSNNGLSASDREWLESVLPDSTTVGDVEQAIDDARESEKEEYENQADETEETANDESSAAQGTATSLLSVVGQFIGVLTSAQPTNCNLNGNLIPHLPLGNLNLCQNDPPAAIVVLGSLLLIAFVVPLAYHTVKRMLALIGSFQS